MVFASLCGAPLGGDPAGGRTLVEYVWVAAGSQLRSKTRVLEVAPSCLGDLPVIVVDGNGSGTQDEPGSDVFLKPRKMFADPFRGHGHLLVLCDTFVAQMASESSNPTLGPAASNHRQRCAELLASIELEVPAFAFHQEYVVEPDNQGRSMSTGNVLHPAMPGAVSHPYMPTTGSWTPTQDVDCMHSSTCKPLSAAARRLAEQHLMACLRAGISVSEISQQAASMNLDTDSMFSSHDCATTEHSAGLASSAVWAYKLNPSVGIHAADELWMSRYLMQCISEREGVDISFSPGSDIGPRCRIEVSTASSRTFRHGLGIIEQHMALLHSAQLQSGQPGYSGLPHAKNKQGATTGLRVGLGKCTHPALDITIPSSTLLQQCGHWVDCRPASSADPYRVISGLIHVLRPALQQALVSNDALSEGPDNSELFSCCLSEDLLSLHTDYTSSYDTSSRFSDEADSDDILSSMNSEDVLIDELDRIDQAPTSFVSLKRSWYSHQHDESCADSAQRYEIDASPRHKRAFVEEGYDESR